MSNPVLEIIQYCTRDFWTLTASVILICCTSTAITCVAFHTIQQARKAIK